MSHSDSRTRSRSSSSTRSRSRDRERADDRGEAEAEADGEVGGEAPREGRGGGRGEGDDLTVYVANLPYHVTDDVLKEAFLAFGEVVKAVVMPDPHKEGKYGQVSL